MSRVKFTEQQDRDIWKFFIEKVLKRDPAARNPRKEFWVEFVKKKDDRLSDGNVGYPHTSTSVDNHFRKTMLSRLVDSPLSNEEIQNVIQFCNVKYPTDANYIKRLKKRLKQNFRKDNQGFLRLVSESNQPFADASPASASFDDPVVDGNNDALVDEMFPDSPTIECADDKRKSTGADMQQQLSTFLAKKTVVASQSDYEDDFFDTDPDDVTLTEDQLCDLAIHGRLWREAHKKIFTSEDEEDAFYREMLHYRARFVALRIIPADKFLLGVPDRIAAILEGLADTLAIATDNPAPSV